jgi:DNA-binding transcriptional ArsR family regulator
MTDDFTSWYLQTHEGMARSAITPPAARILDVLLKLSFLIERKEARVPVLLELVIAANVHKGNLSRHLRELETSKIITEREDAKGIFYYAIQPDWTQWKVRSRYTAQEELRMDRALQDLIEIGKADPEQQEFAAAGFARDDFDAEVSRAFAAAAPQTGVVHGTTDGPAGAVVVVPSTTSEPVVPGTTEPFHEGVVRGTTDAPFKALRAIELNSSKAPMALGAETAARPEPDEGLQPTRLPLQSGGDPDFELLIERMWKVIPDQREQFAGAWVNRGMRIPRAMRMAVDKFLESPPQKLRTTTWQWLRAEYIANAYRLGQEQKLSEQDQLRRGWWKRIVETAKHSMWL